MNDDPKGTVTECRHVWDELVEDRVEIRGLRGTIDMEREHYYICRICQTWRTR